MVKVKGHLEGDIFWFPGKSLYWVNLECGHRLHFQVSRDPQEEIEEDLYVAQADRGTAWDPTGTSCPCARLVGRRWDEAGIYYLPTQDGEVEEVELCL